MGIPLLFCKHLCGNGSDLSVSRVLPPLWPRIQIEISGYKIISIFLPRKDVKNKQAAHGRGVVEEVNCTRQLCWPTGAGEEPAFRPPRSISKAKISDFNHKDFFSSRKLSCVPRSFKLAACWRDWPP